MPRKGMVLGIASIIWQEASMRPGLLCPGKVQAEPDQLGRAAQLQ